jgi:hypothetical protein
MTTLNTNGRSERKSLASQLDRLDRILDGLADGLNEAVAQAVKEAVVIAVEAALRELLASADLRRRLHPEPADRPGLVRRAAAALGRGLVNAAKKGWHWVTTVARRGREKAADAMAALQQGTMTLGGRARRGLTVFVRRVWLAALMVRSLVRRFRKPLLVALASGLVIGVGCYLAGPAVASTVSGLAGFAASLAASLVGRLRWLLCRAALQEWYVGRLP